MEGTDHPRRTPKSPILRPRLRRVSPTAPQVPSHCVTMARRRECKADSLAPNPRQSHIHRLSSRPRAAALSWPACPRAPPEHHGNNYSGLTHAAPALPRRCAPRALECAIAILIACALGVSASDSPRGAPTLQSRDVTSAFRRDPGAPILRSSDFTSLPGRDAGRRLLANDTNCVSALMFSGAVAQADGFLFSFADPSVSVTAVSPPIVYGNGLMAVTGTLGQAPGQLNMFLASFDADGELAWFVSVQVPGASGTDGVSVTAMPNGNLTVCGDVYINGAAALMVSTFDPTGGLVWSKSVTSGDGVTLVTANKVTVSPTTGVITVTGSLGSALLTAAFQSSGHLLWASALDAPASYAFLSSAVALRPDGGAVITGVASFSDPFGAVVPSILLVSYASSGALQWTTVVNSTESNVVTAGNGVAVDSGGNITVTGRVAQSVFVGQFSSSGDLLWLNQYAGASTAVQITGFSIVLTGDSRIVVIGRLDTQVWFLATSSLFMATLNATGGLLSSYTVSVSPYNVMPSGGVLGPGGTVVVSGVVQMGNAAAGEVFLSRFSPTTTKLTFAADSVSFSPLSPTSIHVSQLDLVFGLAGTAMPANLTQAPLPGVSVDIPPTVQWYTYSVNSAALGSLPGAALMYPWSFTLPLSSLFLHLPTSPLATVQISNAPWLGYDKNTGILSGTPLEIGAPITMTVVVESVNGGDLGTFTFPRLTLSLCVSATPRSYLAFVDLYQLQAVQAGDGGVYLSGFPSSASGDGVVLACFNATGELAWAHIYSPQWYELYFDADPASILLTPSGDLVMVGQLKSFFDATFLGLFLTHLTPSGGILSAVMHVSNSTAFNMNGASLSASGNSVIVTGAYTTGTTGPTGLFLASFNITGDLLWVNSFSFPGNGPLAGQACAEGPGGVTYITGNAGSAAFVLAVNASGGLAWLTTLSPPVDQSSATAPAFTANGLTLLPSGVLVVTGASGVTTVSTSSVASDMLVASLSPEGAVLWVTTAVVPGAYCVATSAFPARDGSIAVAGTCRVPPTYFYPTHLLLASFAPSGALAWAKTMAHVQVVGNPQLIVRPTGELIVVAAGLLAEFTDSGYVVPPYLGGPFTVPVSSGPAAYTVAAPATLSRADWDVFTSSALPVDSSPNTFDTSLSGYIILGSLSPFVQVPFRKLFMMTVSDYVLPGTAISLVGGAGGTPLPSWLTYDSVTALLSGYPTGSVRQFYYVSVTLLWLHEGALRIVGSNTADVTFCLNVTNTAPFYSGPEVLHVGLGTFGFHLVFEDAEGDAVSDYLLSTFNGAEPASLAQLAPSLGQLTGTAVTGNGGEYHLNVTAADSFGAVGWAIIVLRVTEPSQILNQLQAFWPFLASGFVLVWVSATLIWRDRITEKSERKMFSLSHRLCMPELLTGTPSATDLGALRRDLIRAVVEQLDNDDYDCLVLMRLMEEFCAGMVAFSVKGDMERNFMIRLSIEKFFNNMLRFVESRVSNDQLKELRGAKEEVRACCVLCAVCVCVHVCVGLCSVRGMCMWIHCLWVFCDCVVLHGVCERSARGA